MLLSAKCICELVQERRNPRALATELRLSCTNPSIYFTIVFAVVGSILGLTSYALLKVFFSNIYKMSAGISGALYCFMY